MDFSAANTGMWNAILQFGIIAVAILVSNFLCRRVGFIKKLAAGLNLSFDQLNQICSNEKKIVVEKYNLPATVRVKNKQYTASFEYDNKLVEIPVCDVNEDSTPFIENFATWDVEDYIDEKELEEINEVLVNAKG